MPAFAEVKVTETGVELDEEVVRGPSSTWTYLINDRAFGDLGQMLYGHGSTAFALAAVVSTWPLLFAWSFWRWLKRKK